MTARPLIIDEGRHEALRLRGKALHVSEDELVRRAIDVMLAESPPAVPDHLLAAAEFLEAAREIAETRVGAEPYRLCRDEIYEEREALDGGAAPGRGGRLRVPTARAEPQVV